jgi:hypothetical protein
VDLDGQANSSRTFAETFTAEPGTLTEVRQAVSKHLTLIAADAVVSPLSLNGYSIPGITDLQKTIHMV